MSKAKILFLVTSLFLTVPAKHGKANTASVAALPEEKRPFEYHARSLFNLIGLDSCNLSYDVFENGLKGYTNLMNAGKLRQNAYLAIIDFGKPSTSKRLWIIDLQNKKVLFHTLVAHGKNTGEDLAVNFSNKPNSNMSSLGFYVTGETYTGNHGLSLYLDGADNGYNCKARERLVVMHGADYVSEDFIKCNGRLGRSHGCPAVSMDLHDQIINVMKDKNCLFIYHPSHPYKSKYLSNPS